MSNLEKAKLYIVEGPLDQKIDAEKLKNTADGKPELEVQFNPATLQVSLMNSLKENEKDTKKTASQYIGNSSSSMSVEFVFDTSDTFRNKVNDDGNLINPKDVRDYVKIIAANFMTPSYAEKGNQVPRRCLFAWGTFLFAGIMESLEETLDFFSPNGTPLRATVSIKLSESRFQFINREAAIQKSETPSPANANSSPTEAAQKFDKENNKKSSRAIALNSGAESLREKSPDALSLPAKKTVDDLKKQAEPKGAKDDFSDDFRSVDNDQKITNSIEKESTGLSNDGLSKIYGKPKVGGLSNNINISPPAFNLGASSSIGTSIPGAFSADFDKGGGLPAGSLILGGAALRDIDENSKEVANNLKSKNALSESISGNDLLKNTVSSVGFD